MKYFAFARAHTHLDLFTIYRLYSKRFRYICVLSLLCWRKIFNSNAGGFFFFFALKNCGIIVDFPYTQRRKYI